MAHEGRPAVRMLPSRVRSFRAFSTSRSSIFRKTCKKAKKRIRVYITIYTNNQLPTVCSAASVKYKDIMQCNKPLMVLLQRKGSRIEALMCHYSTKTVDGSIYLSESSLFGLFQSEDPSTLQQRAERQALALTHARHLPLGAHPAVDLVELQHQQTVVRRPPLMTSLPCSECSLPTHLPQDHLLALGLPGQQQQAADQQLLLQRETLSVRGSAPAALRRHAVAVHLGQHPGHLRQADPRAWVKRRKEGSEETQQREKDRERVIMMMMATLTTGFHLRPGRALPLVALHYLYRSPGGGAEATVVQETSGGKKGTIQD